ncbi:hypothetical protein pdam_00017560, partial [Pocillopora damicornis]
MSPGALLPLLEIDSQPLSLHGWICTVHQCHLAGIVLRNGLRSLQVTHPWRLRGCESISSKGRRAPGDIVLQDKFQTVAVVLASDWCQKIFYALESFHVFNTEMYKKLSCSPCLFRLCDDALLE